MKPKKQPNGAKKVEPRVGDPTEYPCWRYSKSFGYWHWYSMAYPEEEMTMYNYTHWLPNQDAIPRGIPSP